MPEPGSSPRVLVFVDQSLDFVEFIGDESVIKRIATATPILSGFEPQYLIGRHYRDIIHPDDFSPAAQAFARVLRGESAGPITLRFRHQDGSWRSVQASARNFLNDPAVAAIIVLARDMSGQVNAEASLAEANIELRRLSQQLLVTQEKERSRIALELHDDVQQILVGLRMGMEASARPLSEPVPIDLVNSWVILVRQAIDHLHQLTLTLRAPRISERGLAGALRAHVDNLRLAPEQTIELEVGDLGSLTPDVELACFRIVQEALANAISHSGANCLQVCVRRNGSDLCASVRDNGAGFDVSAVRARAREAGSIGLLSMRERAALVGGRLDLNSSVGQGTLVQAVFPGATSIGPRPAPDPVLATSRNV